MQLVLLSVPGSLKCSVVSSSTVSIAQCGLSELKIKFPETGRVPNGRWFSPGLLEKTLSDRLWGCLVRFTEGLMSCGLSEAHCVADHTTVLLSVLILGLHMLTRVTPSEVKSP